MKVKFTYQRVLANADPIPVCAAHGKEITHGGTYVIVNDALIICEKCLKHMNNCRKLFKDVRPVSFEKEIK